MRCLPTERRGRRGEVVDTRRLENLRIDELRDSQLALVAVVGGDSAVLADDDVDIVVVEADRRRRLPSTGLPLRSTSVPVAVDRRKATASGVARSGFRLHRQEAIAAHQRDVELVARLLDGTSRHHRGGWSDREGVDAHRRRGRRRRCR